MATTEQFASYIVEQIQDAGEIMIRKMFGEYCIYSDGKVFGFLCDNKLFIKPTVSGRDFMGAFLAEGYPFPQAKKPCLLVEDKIEDSLWLSQLVRVTVAELPMQKTKKKKREIHGKKNQK